MPRNRHKLTTRDIDPVTGRLPEHGEPTAPRKRRGIMVSIKQATMDAIVRRTSTKP
jgi:hypothetical protein